MRTRKRDIIFRIVVTLLVIIAALVSLLWYFGKLSPGASFESARHVFADVGKIKGYTLTIKRDSLNNKNLSVLEYYASDTMENVTISKNNNVLTEVILDYAKGCIYVRIDTLNKDGVEFSGIENIGREWNGEKWIECKNYMVLNVRKLYSDAQLHGDTSQWDSLIKSTPRISSLIKSNKVPAYMIRDNNGDDLIYLYSDFIVSVLEASTDKKLISRTGWGLSTWHIKAEGTGRVMQMISGLEQYISDNEADERMTTMLSLIGKATGKQESIQSTVDTLQQLTGVNFLEKFKSLVSGNKNTVVEASVSFTGEVGTSDILLSRVYTNDSGQEMEDSTRIEFVSKRNTLRTSIIPEEKHCIECKSLEEFKTIEEYLKLSNIINKLFSEE